MCGLMSERSYLGRLESKESTPCASSELILLFTKKGESMEYTLHDLQCGGYKILQSDGCFKFGTDAVLLANFAGVQKGRTAVDLGTGIGIIPVLMCAKTAGNFIGIEINEKAADIAIKNARINDIEDRFRVVKGDIRNARELVSVHVSVVVVNPPYDKAGSGGVSANEAVRMARHEGDSVLDDFIRAGSALLKTGGRFYTINRASRSAELIHKLSLRKLTPKEILFVAPRAGEEARFVLVKCIKDAAEGVRVLPTLYVEDEKGEYTDKMREIYGLEE